VPKVNLVDAMLAAVVKGPESTAAPASVMTQERFPGVKRPATEKDEEDEEGDANKRLALMVSPSSKDADTASLNSCGEESGSSSGSSTCSSPEDGGVAFLEVKKESSKASSSGKAEDAIYRCELCKEGRRFGLVEFLRHQREQHASAKTSPEPPTSAPAPKRASAKAASKKAQTAKSRARMTPKASPPPPPSPPCIPERPQGSLLSTLLSPSTPPKNSVNAGGNANGVKKRAVFTCKVCGSTHASWEAFCKYSKC